MVEIDPRALMALAHDDFRDQVDLDLRPAAGGDTEWHSRHAALRSPTVVDRWFTVLSQIAKSVEGQLAAATEDYEAQKATLRAKIITATAVHQKNLKARLEEVKANYSRKRAGTLRFKTGLDEALIEARALRDGIRDRLYDSVVAEERNRYAARVKTLEDAIRDHRDALDKMDIDPEDHDEHLWAVIADAADRGNAIDP